MDTKRLNKINKYKCEHCKKEYTRKSYFIRHELCCKAQILSKSRREINLDIEEEKDTPNIRELYLLLQELAIKVKTQEKEINILKRQSKKTTENLSLIDWLEKNEKNKNDWEDYLKNININLNLLNYIFTLGFINGTVSIIKETLNINGNCLKCFEQKKNTLFIFKNSKWKIMNSNEFEELLNKVNSLVMKQFKVWQNLNEKMIFDNSNKYQEYVQKIVGEGISKEIMEKQIKIKLYNTLKLNLKRIIEFEFT